MSLFHKSSGCFLFNCGLLIVAFVCISTNVYCTRHSTFPRDPVNTSYTPSAGGWINQSEWSACFSFQLWNDLLPIGTKRTNSAVGIGQISPQNVICLLLCWTMLANRTKTIHASMCTFARMQYNWGKAIGDQSGRFAYRNGVKHICFLHSVPLFTAVAYSS